MTLNPIDVTEGAGPRTIAFDTIGGADYCIDVMAWGPTGTATRVDATTGAALPIRGVFGAQPVPVDGSGVTQPVSGTVGISGTVTVGLATGAATEAKQPAFGTPGTPSLDVLSIQGRSGMTPVQVSDGGGSLTVDGTVAFSNTTIAATQSGTWAMTDGGGSLTVDGTVSLGAGSASIGTLGANSGTDIGDVTINNGTGAAAVNIQDGGNSITVDGSVSVSGLVPGVSATSLGKAEDAIAADGDTGVMTLAVRKDTPATTVGSDGDYHPLEVDANGRLWCSSIVTGTVAVTQSGTWNVTNAGTFAVQAAQAGSWSTTLLAGSAAIGKLAANDGVDIGDVTINNASGASAVNIQDGGNSITVDGAVAATQSGTWNIATVTALTAITNALPAGTNTLGGVFPVPVTSGGCDTTHFIAANSNNATSLKASAGQLYGVGVSNNNATPVYLKFYNKASTPSPGSDNALIKWVVEIPGNTAGASGEISWPEGIPFSTGIAYAVVAGMSDTDNTSVAAASVNINIRYK